jgi:hypothetical protein
LVGILLVACAGAGGAQSSSSGPGGSSGPSGSAEAAPSGSGIAGWVEPVEEVDEASFAPLDGPDDLAALRPELESWWHRIFRPEASPVRSETVRLSARAASGGVPDLVRSDYDMAVVRLEVLDSARWTLIRIADPGVDVADGAAAQVILRRVLAVGPDRRWDVSFPERLAEGEWYASAPGMNPGAMESYRDRIGARVVGGRLELLCVKRPLTFEGDPAGWFPSALRARTGTAQ